MIFCLQYSCCKIMNLMLRLSIVLWGLTPKRQLPEIKDHYPQYIVTLDELASGNINGIKILHLSDFLLETAGQLC